MSAQLQSLPNYSAAIYLRSSKDRSDVSIDAQRRKLQETATRLNLTIAEEFVDAVESGKDDDRPGYQQMLSTIRSRQRRWQHLIALDTSRIARSRYIALAIENDCRKVGITMHFANIPDMDEITGVLVKSVFQAMDEVHSLTSRAKGLAGMAENIQRGFRAGGRAPRGYDLQHMETGVIREGRAVTKSKLVVNTDSQVVLDYLKSRALGEPRGAVSSRLKMPWPQTSLVDMEWQALTYAGHTVWGVHNPRINGSYVDGVKGKSEYKNGTKRKPRAEWKITRDTHEALITDDEAEAILNRLEKKKNAKTILTNRTYLLTGLLQTSTGERWHGDWDRGEGYYRLGKGQRVSATAVDQAVLDTIYTQMQSDQVVKKLMAEITARARVFVPQKKSAGWKRKITELAKKVSKLVDQLIDADDNLRIALRRSIEVAEAERAELQRLVDENENAREAKVDAQAVTESEVRAALRTFLSTIEAASETSTDKTKRALEQIVQRVELDQKSELVKVHLNMPDFASQTHKEKATEETSVASFAVFRPLPEISGEEAGNFGVPTGIHFIPANKRPFEIVLPARWVDVLDLSSAAIKRKTRRMKGLPVDQRGWRYAVTP